VRGGRARCGTRHTVSHNGRRLQLPASPLRAHYVKACVKVREYPDGTLAVFHGPRRIARYDAEGAELLVVSTAGSLTPCSPPSRRGLAAAEFAARVSRRPALTAAAAGVPAPARVGTWRNRGVTTAGTQRSETMSQSKYYVGLGTPTLEDFEKNG
jgi:hypothetical protein